LDDFRTIINAPEFPFSITHENKVALLGSCFAQKMGAQLCDVKIPTLINPFGILFNPFSIMNALERMLNNRPYGEHELIDLGESIASLDHHGRFNGKTAAETLHTINKELLKGADFLRSSHVLFITLGSAWVYRHLSSDHIVANCHKIPNKAFRKELLSFQDVHLTLRQLAEFVALHVPNINIVFTVSPVRHWKDGAIENQRSKALLISALHQVVDEFEHCHYFPAYEMMMDDLRDYRFYNTDMLHPSPQAIDYVWQKFQLSFFTNECRIVCNEVRSVVQSAEHRPIDPESNSFQRFVRKQLEIINALEAKYPSVDMSAERLRFENFLI